MAIRIDGLNPTALPSREHVVPAMKDGLTVKLTIGQILDLLVGAAPGALDTLDELAAALGDDANFATTVTNALAGKQPIDAMLSALAALTSSNGKFLAFSGADAPTVRDIVGTVAQSGGAPTGAIIERGANANGNYIRYADGTQVCWAEGGSDVTASTAAGGVFTISSAVTFTFPAPFISEPLVNATGRYVSGGAPWFSNQTLSATTCTIRAWAPTTGSVSRVGYVAFGRWF